MCTHSVHTKCAREQVNVKVQWARQVGIDLWDEECEILPVMDWRAMNVVVDLPTACDGTCER